MKRGNKNNINIIVQNIMEKIISLVKKLNILEFLIEIKLGFIEILNYMIKNFSSPISPTPVILVLVTNK